MSLRLAGMFGARWADDSLEPAARVWGRVGLVDRQVALPACPVSRLLRRPLGQSNTHTLLLSSSTAASCGVGFGRDEGFSKLEVGLHTASGMC